MKFTHTITDLPQENEYPKLVRDRIPEIIKKNDKIDVPISVLSDEEFERRLRQKAIEEAAELASAESDTHLLEEIADLREILETLEALKGFTVKEVKAIQDEKRKKRGGFHRRLLMLKSVDQSIKDNTNEDLAID